MKASALILLVGCVSHDSDVCLLGERFKERCLDSFSSVRQSYAGKGVCDGTGFAADFR